MNGDDTDLLAEKPSPKSLFLQKVLRLKSILKKKHI